ncbi:transmembrane protein, distant homology with ydbT [Candidatus Syntrophocurvum alkaliphilum]|uniref:Transmembrane protein, distant homology with ydbT n=1 Tax=Candidatus Syntrophocurvum alkaliphilum TaxID=2293317 RepID=A0A6I6DIE4_9FIRM|nr:PH domain-containing protein [Candidatus Syntrophocurvum alkaliphilum]QGU00499.1 transmembrane protein, distant homology with ydbT [Candidatus Syntrophocurvum alkaliphilum]
MNDWKRQHPAAVFISFLSNLKEMVISLIAIFVLGQTSPGLGSNFYFVIMGVILFLSLVNGFFKWWTFKYHLVGNELNAKQGLIFRKKRYIRKERIHSIDINAKLVQRLFGLVELRIETAGGGNEPEFKIIALEREEAVRIKQELLQKEVRYFEDVLADNEHEDIEDGAVVDSDEGVAGAVEELPSFRWELSGDRLLIAAATSSGVGIAATFIAVIVSQAPQFLPEAVIEEYVRWFIQSSILMIGALIAFILFAAWLFTVVTTILKYGYFTIEKRGNDIHISRGVLEQRQLTLYAQRITAVRIVQNPLRQPFGFVAVFVESAGGGRQDEDLSTILVPLCKRNEVNSILEETIPDLAIDPEYEGLPRESLRRYLFRLLIPALIVAGVVSYLSPYGWIAIVLPLIAVLVGIWQYKDAGITQVGDILCLRKRVFSKLEVIVPRKRIQSMMMTQTVLQKFDDLYTIHVSILSSVTGKTFSVRHIGRWQKEEALGWYSYEVNDGSRINDLEF